MSSDYKELVLPNYEEIPELEHSAMLKVALEVCGLLKCQLSAQSKELELQSNQLELQTEQLMLQAEQIRCLKDEIAVLKGEKPRPKIKPSKLNKDKGDKDNSSGGSGSGKKRRKRGKPVRKKTKGLKIHEEVICYPEHIPEGSVFKGYEDYVVPVWKLLFFNPSRSNYRPNS
jgi:hypothetical protein